MQCTKTFRGILSLYHGNLLTISTDADQVNSILIFSVIVSKNNKFVNRGTPKERNAGKSNNV